MPTLEDCINPGCRYELQFDDYVVGKSKLSSGECPTCGAATLIFCPGCHTRQVTRVFVRNLFSCHICESSLRRLAETRKVELVGDARRRRGLNDGTALSPREIEVVKLLAEGRCNKEIAVALSISVSTVETYRTRIMLKVNAHSIVEIVYYAFRQKLLPLSRFSVE